MIQLYLIDCGNYKLIPAIGTLASENCLLGCIRILLTLVLHSIPQNTAIDANTPFSLLPDSRLTRSTTI